MAKKKVEIYRRLFWVKSSRKECGGVRVYFVMFSICLLLPSGFPSQSKVLGKIVSFENIASAVKYSSS